MALHLAAGQPRTLTFTEGIRKDLKLLEVDEELLKELLESGLCLKGAPGEEAVLCSATQTFAVKNVETTNLVLLVQEEPQPTALSSQDLNAPAGTPPGVLRGLSTQLRKNQAAAEQPPVVASALVSSHLDLVPTAPRLHQLDDLLQEHVYGSEDPDPFSQQGGGLPPDDNGQDLERSGRSAGGFTECELLQRVQCSRAELREALRERKALCLDGRYCSVDGSFQAMLLELVLLTATEHGWSLDRLPGGELAAALEPHGYDPRCMSGGGSSGHGCYALDEAAVCLHYARSLLQTRCDWELDSFMQEWQRRVPEGMLPSLEMLRGEARQYGGTVAAAGLQQPRRIKHFPLSALPQTAGARFAALFAEQPRWEWEDLAPYVQSLQGPGQTAEALLLKYARASQQRPSDPVTYSAR